MKKIKYVLSVILIIAGLGGLVKNSLVAGLLLIILGILFFPQISDKIANGFKIWKNKFVRYTTYVFLFLVAGSLMKKTETESSKVPVKEEVQALELKNEPKIKMDNSEFWKKFDPIVKQRIYQMIKDKDCASLQQEFNTTADNMDRLQKAGKSASRNLDLMNFLDNQMKELECY